MLQLKKQHTDVEELDFITNWIRGHFWALDITYKGSFELFETEWLSSLSLTNLSLLKHFIMSRSSRIKYLERQKFEMIYSFVLPEFFAIYLSGETNYNTS